MCRPGIAGGGPSHIRALLLDASLLGEALAELRPGLPVILCSGHDRQRVEDQFMVAGAAAFLQKPFTVEQLLKTVQGTLEAEAK